MEKPRIVVRLEDHGRFSVLMYPGSITEGYEGGRAMLTRAEATTMRDALDAVLGFPIIPGRCNRCNSFIGFGSSETASVAPPAPARALAAEQLVDLAAEAITLIGDAFGRPRLHDAHLDSPSFRLARAAGVVPKALRDRPEREAR